MNTLILITLKNAINNNKVLLVLFLDVKGAFDHVSLNQLLKVMKRLHLPLIVLRWVQCFFTNRSITLVFNGERNQSQSVNSEISHKNHPYHQCYF